ncbi:unnamed protein product [Chondrus crispus]|uniref:Uncharacterized protein n=1 Tax=Chondrus crispus TaxID=2769 RepID=R7QKK9_CHOCR|nr:unnamed protein product [Chondrus crispus]CDF38614.1 unnamed protein product [Chondrus crispus]|eukprot:XP_005718519.1 unnamed protein product [Chondrus crispus]
MIGHSSPLITHVCGLQKQKPASLEKVPFASPRPPTTPARYSSDRTLPDNQLFCAAFCVYLHSLGDHIHQSDKEDSRANWTE